MERSKNKGRLFVVLEFLKLPYPNIDQHVCVPHSWILLRRTTDPRVISMYPVEDAFQTRERVKRQEKYMDEWKFYLALVKYEAATYNDAEMWIATRSNYAPIYEEISEVNIEDSQKIPTLDRKLRSSNRHSRLSFSINKPQMAVKPYANPRKPVPRMSIKRPGLDELNEKLDKERFDLKKKKVTPTSDFLCYLNLKSKCSNSVKFASTSNDEKRTPPEPKSGKKSPVELDSTNANQPSSPERSSDKQLSPVHNEQQQYRSMAEICVIESDEVMNIDRENQAEAVVESEASTKQISSIASKQPSESEFTQKLQISPLTEIIATLEENNVRSHATDVQSNIEATQPIALNSNSISQPNQPYQHIQLPYLGVNQNKFVIPQSIVNNTPCTSPNLVNQSPQLNKFLSKKSSPSVIKKTIDKKRRVENITNTISATLQNISNLKHQLDPLTKCLKEPVQSVRQNYFQEVSRVPETQVERPVEINSFDHTTYDRDMAMNVSSAQNHPNSAQQLPRYSQNYHGYLQQAPNEAQSFDQRARLQNTMSNGLLTGGLSKNPINPVNQPYQFSTSSQMNQHLPLNLYYFQQEQLRQELLRKSTESTFTNCNPQPQDTTINIASAQQNFLNVLNQSLPVFEHSHQRQISQRLQDPRQVLHVPRVHNDSHIQRPFVQKVMQRTLPTLSEISNSKKESQRTIEQNNMHLTVPQNIITEPAHTVQYLGVQPMSLPVHPHEAQAISTYGNYGYQNPYMQKIMVNQSTETNFSVKHVHFEDQTKISPATERSCRRVDQSCQTDGYDMEELPSPSQETVLDHEIDSDHEGTFDHEVSLGDKPVLDYETFSEEATVGISNNENISSENSMENVSTVENPTTSTIHQEHFITNEMQEIFNEGAAVFNQIHSSITNTCETFNNLQKMIIDSAVTYQQLFQVITKLDVMKNMFNTGSTFNSATSTEKLITEERQNEEKRRPNSGKGDENNANKVKKATKMKRAPRRSFVLPPEYDPKRSQWTLKHRHSGPGITELLPGSEVYVDAVQLENCKQAAKDYKSLARMVLTEVYSRSALSVCSLTGAKAKAFRNVSTDVRPGLDQYAKIVLLAFLEKHGRDKGWDIIDTQRVLSSIRSKIQEIRNKYGRKA